MIMNSYYHSGSILASVGVPLQLHSGQERYKKVQMSLKWPACQLDYFKFKKPQVTILDQKQCIGDQIKNITNICHDKIKKP